MARRLSWLTGLTRAAACAVICGAVMASVDQRGVERQNRTRAALDAYAVGRWDEAVALAAADPDFESLLREFPDTSAAWARTGSDSAHRSTRVLNADVLALELANASLRDALEWARGRPLIYLTYDHVTTSGRTPFEHAWALAATALLDGPPDRSKEWAQLMTWLEGRFPTDGRFALAAVTNRREARLLEGHPSGNPDLIADADRLRQTLSDLAALERMPNIRAEAALRRGVIEFEIGDLARAHADLAIAGDPSNSGDTFTRYLGHLVSARAFEVDVRRTEAAGEYDRAVETLPGAQSAQIAQAFATMDTSRRFETAAALDRALTREPPVPDPWHGYTHGEYRRWPEDIAALRAMLKQ